MEAFYFHFFPSHLHVFEFNYSCQYLVQKLTLFFILIKYTSTQWLKSETPEASFLLLLVKLQPVMLVSHMSASSNPGCSTYHQAPC